MCAIGGLGWLAGAHRKGGWQDTRSLAAGTKITQVIIMSTTSNLRKKADTEVIVKYIKNDLYPRKSKFLYTR
jgi:hypothetical protein